MNFNFVEGQYSRLSEENFEEFRDDYLHSELSTQEVREQWGLSKREYAEITREIRNELGLKSRPFTRAKHFYKKGNQWHIIKTRNKERTYYGSLPCSRFSEDEMKDIVKKLESYDWKYTSCQRFLRELERCHI